MTRPRALYTLLLAWGCASACLGQTTIVADDRAFSGVPFEKWLAEGDQGKFHWSSHLNAGELSNHLRLKVKVDLQVDGNDVAARRGHGYLVMLVQFEDSDHRIYRSHGSLDLQQATEAAAKSDVVYTQEAFVRPGEYQVSLLIFDTKTGEHSALQRKLRANPLKNDPFPSAWDRLPAVEFVSAGDAPDIWYQPLITGRLDLPLETRRPVRLEVILNASPTVSGSGVRTGQVNNRSLGDLLPALKVISQVKLDKGTMRVTLLDLTRQSVLFENTGGDLDWPQVRAGLVQADPNKIDARSLAQRRGNAQFFIGQVRERLDLGRDRGKSHEAIPVGIVLSGPMAFDSGEDRHPIDDIDKFAGKLFYIRYHDLPLQQIEPGPPEVLRGNRRNIGALPPWKPQAQEPLDALLNLVRPLQPHVFDVYTPEQFRKALSTMLDEISRL